MTLVHLSTVHPRADTRILIKEARTLAARLPHQVVLMIADGKGSADDETGRVSIHDLGRPGGGRCRRLVVGPWRAYAALARLKPALVHFHDPELIPLGLLLKLRRVKVVYDVHEDVPRQILSKHWLPGIIRRPVAWMMSALEWSAARAFDAIVPATSTIAERFPAGKTVTVHNFPIAAELAPAVSIPYHQRPPAFVYAGLIAKVRGIEEIIGAFESLRDLPEARLDLAGTFDPAGLVDRLRALPGWAAVRYHGEVSRKEVARLLGGARAGLVVHHPIPNEVNALPIKMYEYMAAGLPVIASDFPLLRKTIDGARCGLLVEPVNSQAIENALRWVLSHPAEAEAMGGRGRQAVEEIYNWSTEAAKLVRLYEKLLAS